MRTGGWIWVLVVLGLGVGACTSTDDADEAASDGDASMCVEVVRLAARNQVDAALLSKGEPARFYPDDADAVDAYREALPAEFSDRLDLLTNPNASREDLQDVGADVDTLLADECALGADSESPLGDDCEREGMRAARSVASGDADDDALASFAEDCAPEQNPFRELSAPCQGIVYSHYVRPSVDGEFHAGFPSGDDEDAIAHAFIERCN